MMSVVSEQLQQPLSFDFADDGLVPNSRMPLLFYRHAIAAGRDDLANAIEHLFGCNGWGAMWRNGIYDFLHYHATVHEALGVARGNAMVRFGGDNGTGLAIAAGDIAILPAGTGHQCLSASADFSVVGAYPPGARVEITRATPQNYARALQTIPQVPMPNSDPVLGENGPLLKLWKRA